jgi:endonuclease/exonuclease/phosphatase family metal-dependent hydrolase
MNNKDFGNAILSRWRITQDKKVVLPFEDSRTQTKRIAVAAVIEAGGCDVLVYSTHLATFWSGGEKSMLQADAILKSIPQHHPYVIIGGDFNTLTVGRFENLENKFRRYGYILATKGIGKTAKAWPFRFQTDHIFSRGFRPVDAGKVEESGASDHFPIWVRLKRE